MAETIGRYQVIRPLGHGGVGAVFLAWDPSLERQVALKLLHGDPSRSRLRDEAKALAALRHPGIVTVYEIGEHEGREFIAMEYLPGRALRQVLQHGASRAQCLAICADVAKAVAAAHRAGILHRDIKPENIIVGDAGDVKVVDFGLAHRMEHERPSTPRAATARGIVDSLSRTLPPDVRDTIPFVRHEDDQLSPATQTMFGTPAYMAPEVLLGQGSSATSDVYALGVVLHECLVGRRPHDGTTLYEVIAQTIDGRYVAPADPLGPLLARMLARDPAARPALDEVIAQLVPAAAPPAARRRGPLVLAGLGGLGLLAAAAAAVLVAGPWRRHAPAAPATPAPSAAPAAPPVHASLAIDVVRMDLPGYGIEPPAIEQYADVLAGVFAEVGGADLDAASITGAVRTAPLPGASYVARGQIRSDGARLVADFDVLPAARGGAARHVHVERPAPLLAPLLDAVALGIAQTLAPHATLEPDPAHATTFLRTGEGLIEDAQFTRARPYLEQAVDTDPSLYEAWYQLALTLEWMEVAPAQCDRAYARALATAPTEAGRQMIRGLTQFGHGDFEEARATLEPLEHVSDPGLAPRAEMLYFLGEVNWHDGRFDRAYAYFLEALRQLSTHTRPFTPSTVHAWQYQVARRHADAAARFIGFGTADSFLEFARGDYEKVLTLVDPTMRIPALLVLRRFSAPDVTKLVGGPGLEPLVNRIAIAIGQGDDAAARALLVTLWAQLPGEPATPATFDHLTDLGEVLLAADLRDDVRRLVAYLAAHSTPDPARGYERMSMLAAALLDDPSLVIARPHSERDAQLGEIARAEIAGRRAEAARLLGVLIANPSFAWDFPERAQRLRDLRALHRTKEAAALCADTLRPPVFRLAFLALRRACGG